MDAEYDDQVIARNFHTEFTFLKWIANHLISPWVHSCERMPPQGPDRESKRRVFLAQKFAREKTDGSRRGFEPHTLLFFLENGLQLAEDTGRAAAKYNVHYPRQH